MGVGATPVLVTSLDSRRLNGVGLKVVLAALPGLQSWDTYLRVSSVKLIGACFYIGMHQIALLIMLLVSMTSISLTSF